jgi:hypothetical protein
MTREELIKACTEFEITWLMECDDPFLLKKSCIEFFSRGGYSNWDTFALQKKYDEFIN